MLQKIHARVQGVIAWLLIILIAVTFTLWGINYYLEARGATDVQAKVNGEKISKMDFSNAYERLKRHVEEEDKDHEGLGTLSPIQEKRLKHQALKQLIFTRTVMQGANSSGYRITREQAEQALMQIPQFQEGGQFSPEKFQQALSSASYTPSVFLTRVQEGLVINQQRFSFAGTSFVLPEELERFVELTRETRDVKYLIIPAKNFLSLVNVSPSELHDYYESHKAQFKVPEKVSVDYIAVSLKKILPTVHVSDRAIKSYYDSNIDAYTQPAQWKWAHILIRAPENASKQVLSAANEKAMLVEKNLQQGISFAAAVKKYSNDILSVAQNGETEWISETAVSLPILDALKTLKNNQISAPIKTQYGYEIICRLGYHASQPIPFNSVKDQIKTILVTDAAQQTFAEIGDDLTNLSYQNPSSLQDVAKELDLPVQTTPFFTQKGLSKGIASHKAVIQAAFSDEVLRDANNSQLITIHDNKFIVLRVKKHSPESFMPFDMVKATVNDAVIQEKLAIQARLYGENQIQLLNKNPDQGQKMLDEIQKKQGLNWQVQDNVHREDEKMNPVILDTLFAIPLLSNKASSWQGVSLKNGDYALLNLLKVNHGSLDDLDQEEQNVLKDEMEATFGIIDYDLYVEGLMKNADIVENP